MNHIYTYEEARAYLQEDIGRVYDQCLKKATKHNAFIIAVGGSAVFMVIALVTQQYGLFAFIPAMLAWSLSSFMSVIKRNSDIKLIKCGAYFNLKKQEEVIRQANRQLDVYNKYDSLK